MAPPEFVQVVRRIRCKHHECSTPLIAYTGTNLETLATYPAGKARTIQLTLRGRLGKVETHGQAFVWRLRGKTPASLPNDSLAANQNNQLIIEGYRLMQGSQQHMLAQNCISILQHRVQKPLQQQTEATP